MRRFKLAIAFILPAVFSIAQNDVDAIRYSRTGVGGTSRFMSMGGAFGAIGADLSAASYNPAGLGLFRKGEISFSGALRFTNNNASIYNTSGSVSDAHINFNNFGVAIAWPSKQDADSRNVLAFTNTQLQNFNSSVTMSGYTNSNSIAKDMLNLAKLDGNSTNLNNSYEGLGYDTYVIDTANTYSEFYSLVDTKRAVQQTRSLVTSGRTNDINFSYAYAYKDKIYFGLSLGLPQVNYVSTTTHDEVDTKDSMRVGFTSPNTYTSTYVDGLEFANPDKLGFKSLTYTEYFKTSGSGFNLKLGGIARVSDALRIGLYIHTPTFYKMTDTYNSSLTTTFDTGKSYNNTYPANNGVFSYRLVTPARFSANIAYLVEKIAVIGLDYEVVDYKTAQLKSTTISDFAGVNSVLASKYSLGQNLRIGAELNAKPVMVRAGYSMQGSPFGDVFSGNFVRNTFSAGIGFRTKNNFYVDFALYRTMSRENYYLFTTLDAHSTINYSTTSAAVTVGIKF